MYQHLTQLKMPPQTNSTSDLDPQVVALAKAVRDEESGGNPTAHGKSGEYGAYQYMPGTWAKQSADAGVNVPLEQATKQQQNQVWYTWAKSKKDQGYNVGQIASMQNAGEGEPDAYKGTFSNGSPSKGTNKEGVDFDVPGYATKVSEKYQNYKGESQPVASGTVPDSSNTLASQVSKRATDALKAGSDALSGNINPISGVLQVGGAAGGLVGDLTNDALKLIPGVSETEDAIGKGVGKLANTELGQKVIGAGQDFSQKNPELAADIGAVGNIASAVPAIKGLGIAKDVVEGALTGAGKNALVDAISPEIKAGTKAGATDVASNGTAKSGLLGKVSRLPDPEMVEAAPVVKEVAPRFMKLPTFSEKLSSVQDGIGKLATKLEDNLAKGEVQPILTPEDINSLQESINTEIAQNPLLVGDAGKQAQQIFDQFKRFLPQDRDITMSDVLSARKKLDGWISKIKGDTVFDPKTENAISVGLRAVRQGANNLLDTKVPEGEVKSLLRKQSLLYKVVDNLSPKVSKEVGSTNITRFMGRHPGLIGAGKYLAGSAAAGLGLGGAEKLLK